MSEILLCIVFPYFYFTVVKYFVKQKNWLLSAKGQKNIGIHAPHRITDSFIKVSQAGEEK